MSDMPIFGRKPESGHRTEVALGFTHISTDWKLLFQLTSVLWYSDTATW